MRQRLPDLRIVAAVGQWANDLVRVLTASLSDLESNKQTRGQPVLLASYTVAELPSPDPAGQLVLVTNEIDGRVMAVSDGTKWCRPDGTEVIADA